MIRHKVGIERERERRMNFAINTSQVTKERTIIATAKPKSIVRF